MMRRAWNRLVNLFLFLRMMAGFEDVQDLLRRWTSNALWAAAVLCCICAAWAGSWRLALATAGCIYAAIIIDVRDGPEDLI